MLPAIRTCRSFCGSWSPLRWSGWNGCTAVSYTHLDVYKRQDVHRIANEEKLVPRNWMTRDGSYVTEDFIDYIKPLIQGDYQPIMVNGLPRHLVLNMKKKRWHDTSVRGEIIVFPPFFEFVLDYLGRNLYNNYCLLYTSSMEKELELLTKAAREMYELQFPGEGGLPE